MLDGSAGAEAYLSAWEWGPYREVQGSAEVAAAAEAQRINSSFPMDFVARIRDLDRSGERKAAPGAVDTWMDEEKPGERE